MKMEASRCTRDAQWLQSRDSVSSVGYMPLLSVKLGLHEFYQTYRYIYYLKYNVSLKIYYSSQWRVDIVMNLLNWLMAVLSGQKSNDILNVCL